VGVLPTDPALAATGLADLAAALGAKPLTAAAGPAKGRARAGSGGAVRDAAVSGLQIAGGTPAGALAWLKREVKAGAPARPLVLADADRGDLVEALVGPDAAAHAPAGLLLCGVPARSGRHPAAGVAAGVAAAGAAHPPGSPLPPPILTTPLAVGEAFLAATTRATPSLKPTSTAKIAAAIALWRASIPPGALEGAGLGTSTGPAAAPYTPPPTDPPARFLARIFASAASPSAGPGGAPRARIVMPEAGDARVLAAAVEVARRGIATPVLLGVDAHVRAAAVAAGLPAAMEGVVIHDPAADPAALASAATRLAAARAHAGLTVDAAAALIAADPTWYGTLLVAAGQADGLVSGAVHTTADTVRPALQLLRGPRVAVAAPAPAGAGAGPPQPQLPTPNLVSSLFFMCLPSGVVAFSDCALCVEPGPADLAAIALASASTAEAFGLGGGVGGAAFDPSSLLPPIRVALLSYSTAASGTGPAVDRVRAAAAIASAAAPPGVAVEGPFQYDAATCPAVAATKLGPAALAASRVAGRANVLVFPSLEAGNIAYKATQAASGAVVVGPLLQGLSGGAANDLSRGCAVPDIVCTVAATVLQARAIQARRGGGGSGGGVAAAAA
jgi:phosphotransacetylase